MWRGDTPLPASLNLPSEMPRRATVKCARRGYFSTMFALRFDVRQEHGQQADQRQKGADVEDKFDAGVIRQLAERRRADAGDAERQPEKESGDHAAFSGHKFLRINQDGREGG